MILQFINPKFALLKIYKALISSALMIMACIITLIFATTLSFGQVHEADSLVHKLALQSEDTAKVSTYDLIAKSYLRSNPITSLQYAEKGLELAERIQYECGIANLNKSIGNAYYAQGRFTEAIEKYIRSLEMFVLQQDTLNIANIYNNLGNLYAEQNNIEVSTRYYKDALTLFERLDDLDGRATILMNLGVQFDEMNEPDTARVYFNEALEIAKQIEFNLLEGLILHNLGSNYKETGNLNQAETYLKESMVLSDLLNDNETKVNSLIELAEINNLRKQHGYALNILDESESISKELGLRPLLSETYYKKSETHEALNNETMALMYFKKYKSLEDSLKSLEKDRALFELMTRKEMELQETEIAALNAQNEYQTQKLKASKLENYILVLFSGFTLIFLLIVAYYFKIRHKSTLRLSSQNSKIRQQKEAIDSQRRKLDSINKELSNLNNDLQEKNIRLRQLNKEKDYLMNVVAHDLKSPLNQIIGLVNLVSISKGKLSDEQKDYLGKIQDVSSRLGNLVNKILDIDSISKKSSNLNIERIDLRDVVNQVVEDYKGPAKEKRIKIRSNINGTPMPVNLDLEHAHQVFANLVSNAIKFSPPKTVVDVNVELQKDKIITEVRDQGPGLNKDDLKKVFKKFSKLSAQPTGNEKSSGLGLSIVKKYVEAMNGKVWVESPEGEGASFKVSFNKV